MKYVALQIERKDISRSWVLVPKDQYDRHPGDPARWGECVDAENHYEDSEYDIEDEQEVEAPQGMEFDNTNWEFIKAHRVATGGEAD